MCHDTTCSPTSLSALAFSPLRSLARSAAQDHVETAKRKVSRTIYAVGYGFQAASEDAAQEAIWTGGNLVIAVASCYDYNIRCKGVMTQNSFRYTRALILVTTYYECRYGGGYTRPFGGFATFRSDFDLDSSRTFQTLAIRDLADRRLVDLSEPSFVENGETTLRITSLAAVRMEKHLEEMSIQLPAIWFDDDGDRIGPLPNELSDLLDIGGFEADLGLND